MENAEKKPDKWHAIESATDVVFEKRENAFPIGAKIWNAAIDEIERLRAAIAEAIDQSQSDLTHVALMTLLKATTWYKPPKKAVKG